MTQINLLPWREQMRRMKNIRLAIISGISVGVSLLLVFIIHLYCQGLIHQQQLRNNYLQSELGKEQKILNILIKEKHQQEAVNSRLQFIFSLRAKSYRAIHLLNELTEAVPEEIILNKVIRKGNFIIISGKAGTNLQVTNFMENLKKSQFFKPPVLSGISVKENNSDTRRDFELQVEQRDN